MAHFARVRILGGWAGITTLLGSEMEALDLAHYKSINGDEGGAWMPSSAIEIGGSGVDMGGLLNIGAAGDFNVDTGATFTIDTGVTTTLLSAVTASGGGTLTGTWTLGGATNISSSGTLTIQNGGDFTSAVGSNVAILFDQGTSGFGLQNSAYATWATGTTAVFDAGSTLTVNGTTVLAGAVTLSGAMTCSEPITLSSNGTIKWRAYLGTDANVTILADAYDEVHVVAATPTADRTYTLAGTAVEGQRFQISYIGASYKITLDYNSGTTLELKNVSTKYTFIELTYISGSWRLVNFRQVA